MAGALGELTLTGYVPQENFRGSACQECQDPRRFGTDCQSGKASWVLPAPLLPSTQPCSSPSGKCALLPHPVRQVLATLRGSFRSTPSAPGWAMLLPGPLHVILHQALDSWVIPVMQRAGSPWLRSHPPCVSLPECSCVHGVCSSGPQGNGSCLCFAGYTGPRCNQGECAAAAAWDSGFSGQGKGG